MSCNLDRAFNNLGHLDRHPQFLSGPSSRSDFNRRNKKVQMGMEIGKCKIRAKGRGGILQVPNRASFFLAERGSRS